MLEAKRTERNLWLKLSGNSLTCHQGGAKFPHTPVVLKSSVGALDCEKIYELGVESAALGKVPNAPTLNAMSAAILAGGRAGILMQGGKKADVGMQR